MPDIVLNAHEARVLGVLIEKEFTTPDQYPLSLNAATNGSNQKSNRSPVVSYLEAEVDVAFQGLVAKGLAGRVMPAGSRVEKFRHNARERLRVSDPGLAVLAELMLRGAQPPGELRSRASRMAELPSQAALSETLTQLMERGFVRRLPPAPGSRAERYQQLLCTEGQPDDAVAEAPARAEPAAPPGAAPLASAASIAPKGADVSDDRMAKLEEEVARLRNGLEYLARNLGVDLPGQGPR